MVKTVAFAVPEDPSARKPERGVLVSFPFLRLYEIELLKSTLVFFTAR
jgi:hypothetical protein